MNRVSTGSDNGLSPIWHQVIISTSVWLLSMRLLGTNFSEILIKIQNLWWSFCPGGDELTPNLYLNWRWLNVNWMPKNKLEWSLHQEKTLFIQGKPFRNVISKVATISLRIPHDNNVDRRNQIPKRLKTILSPQVHFLNISRSRQNGHHFTNSILNAFPSMKISEFPMTFHWNLFLQVQLRISHHWLTHWPLGNLNNISDR